MTTAERSAIQQAGALGDEVFRAALAVCEEVAASFSHAPGCGPAFYQAAREVVAMMKVAA